MMDKLPQLVQSITEGDLRQKCLDAIRRNTEAANMAIAGHDRGVLILVTAVMKDVGGKANIREVRQAMLRCLGKSPIP